MEYTLFSMMKQEDRIKIFDKIAALALLSYDINIEQFKFRAEYSNVLYEVETSEKIKYILKIANFGDHSPEELREGLIWLNELHKHGFIEATRPISNKKDEFLTKVSIPDTNYPVYCSLMTWINGNIIESKSIDTQYAFKWGKLMAELHKVSSNIDYTRYSHLNEWNKVFYWDKEGLFDKKYEKFFPEARKELFHKAIDKVQTGIDKLYASHQPKIIIHADLHNENIHVFENMLYALDFEDVMIGYQVQDIAIALFYVNDHPDYNAIKKAFEEGYKTVFSFPEVHEGEIELFFIGRYLMFANFIIKLANESDKDVENRLARYEKHLLEFITNIGIYKNSA